MVRWDSWRCQKKRLNNNQYMTKYKTYKILVSMVQKIKGVCWTVACLLALAIMVSPCLLIFTVGKDGEMTWMNLFGLVWLVGVFVVFKWKSQ